MTSLISKVDSTLLIKKNKFKSYYIDSTKYWTSCLNGFFFIEGKWYNLLGTQMYLEVGEFWHDSYLWKLIISITLCSAPTHPMTSITMQAKQPNTQDNYWHNTTTLRELSFLTKHLNFPRMRAKEVKILFIVLSSRVVFNIAY